MNYYDEIKQKIIDNEIYLKVKDYSKERNTVIIYFEIGKLLYEAGSKYGENIIENYSDRLMSEVGKKYNKRTLFRMRQFYKIFSNEKVSPVWTHLTWSHFRELLKYNNYDVINYYLNICVTQNLSVRELAKKIKNSEYERLDDKTKEKLINVEELKIADYVKKPILLNNNYNYNDISEKILKKLIMF